MLESKIKMNCNGLLKLAYCGMFVCGVCLNVAAQTAHGEAPVTPGAGNGTGGLALANSYDSKRSGDEAFAAGQYGTAASFYSKYRDEAQKLSDAAAVREAYEREIDALVKGRLSEQAEKRLVEFEKTNQARPFSVALWKADILLLKKDAESAEKILVGLLADIPKGDPATRNVLSSLASARELKKDYEGAADAYLQLYEFAPDSKGGLDAADKMILCLIAGGVLDDATEKLNALSVPPASDLLRVEKRKLLELFLALKKSVADSAVPFAKYLEELKGRETPSQDTFLHTILSLAGDELAVSGHFQTAFDAYNMAYLSAPERTAAIETLSRMIVMLEKLSRKNEAATLAYKLFSLYRDSLLPADLKMRLGTVVCRGAKHKEALEIFISALDIPLSDGEKKNLFDRAIRVLLAEKAYAESEKLRDVFYKGAADSPDAMFVTGTINFAKGAFSDAGKAYLAAGEKSENLRKAAYRKGAEAFFKAEEYANVVDIAGRLLETEPENPVVILRAYAHEAKNENLLACQDYLHYAALVADPVMKAQSYFRAGRLYLAEGRTQDAIRLWSKVLDEFADTQYSAPAGYWLVKVNCDLDNLADAAKYLARLKRSYPISEHTGNALLVLADNLAASGEVNDAASALGELLALDMPGAIKSAALYRRALVAYRAKDYQTALDCVKQLETSFRDEAVLTDAYLLSGDVKKVLNRYEDALVDYTKVAKRRPSSLLALAAAGGSGDCYFALASLNDDEKNYQLAVDSYKIILDSKNATPEYIALALYKTGRALQFMQRNNEASEKFMELVFSVPAQEMESRPLELFWIIKAVNALEEIALKNPEPERTEAAISALRRLGESGVISQEAMRERMRSVRRQKVLISIE